MKFSSPLAIAMILAVCFSYCAIAFVVPSGWTPSRTSSRTASAHCLLSPRGYHRRSPVEALAAENPAKGVGAEEDQEPMDLNLEQMFEVFEAADKEVSDKAVGKNPDETKPGARKDPAEAVGDMLSSFFGGGGNK